MINLLIGPPGGGKSYEAVVYHVLPALQMGRKVITNLPINIDMMAAVVPGAAMLLEIRTASREAGCVVFGCPADYGDSWRMAGTGQGALYIIDEAHKCIPRFAGRGLPVPQAQAAEARLVAIEKWAAEHRHEGADVLFLTQSYGKLSKPICDLVQVTYRVKKKTLFGSNDEYLRKVQDGVRGDVLSETERTYEKRYFPLYKSHTLSVGAVIESDAAKITPAFVKWKRAGYACMILGVVWLGFSLAPGHHAKERPPRAGTSTAKGATKPVQPPASPQKPPNALAAAPTPASKPEAPQTPPQTVAGPSVGERVTMGLKDSASRVSSDSEPLDGLAIHIQGRMVRKSGAVVYIFTTTDNGQFVASQTTADMERAGYKVTPMADCVAKLAYMDREFFVRCDRVPPFAAPSRT